MTGEQKDKVTIFQISILSLMTPTSINGPLNLSPSGRKPASEETRLPKAAKRRRVTEQKESMGLTQGSIKLTRGVEPVPSASEPLFCRRISAMYDTNRVSTGFFGAGGAREVKIHGAVSCGEIWDESCTIWITSNSASFS